MVKLVVGLLVAALVAAFFGFGGIATEFAGAAQLMFFALVALLIVSAVLSLFGTHMPAGGAVVRTFAMLAIVAMVSIGIYAWLQNDMSAERAGRVIDHEAVEIAGETREALSDAGDRTEAFVSDTIANVKDDTSDAASEATDGKSDEKAKEQK